MALTHNIENIVKHTGLSEDELAHNIENIVKDTGLSEDELASLIITKENEGLTNDEIVDLLVSISDNDRNAQTEYDALQSLGLTPAGDKPASENHDDQDELQALQSLGLKPAGDKPASEKQAPGLFDRFKSLVASDKEAKEQRNAAARAYVANSVSDWRDSHPEQWRVGMINSIFGDNSMLSQYYASKQAAEESEKNRESQREYNEYLKEYDRAKAEAEKNSAYKQELNQAEAEMAALNRDLVKANPSDAVVIQKQQAALAAKYPELNSFDTATAQTAYDTEREYAANLNKYKGQIKLNFLTDDEIQNEIDRVLAESWIRPDDSDKIVEALQSKKSTAQLAREASQSAVASHAGKTTGASLDDADLTKKANDAIKNNTSPARLKQEERDKIREMNYTWTTNGWSKR